jgi:hypothetical protein
VRDPPEKENPRLDDRHHLARVEPNDIEALKSFDHSKNFELVQHHLQHRFALLPATAAVVAELAFAVLPR